MDVRRRTLCGGLPEALGPFTRVAPRSAEVRDSRSLRARAAAGPLRRLPPPARKVGAVSTPAGLSGVSGPGGVGGAGDDGDSPTARVGLLGQARAPPPAPPRDCSGGEGVAEVPPPSPLSPSLSGVGRRR